MTTNEAHEDARRLAREIADEFILHVCLGKYGDPRCGACRLASRITAALEAAGAGESNALAAAAVWLALLVKDHGMPASCSRDVWIPALDAVLACVRQPARSDAPGTRRYGYMHPMIGQHIPEPPSRSDEGET